MTEQPSKTEQELTSQLEEMCFETVYNKFGWIVLNTNRGMIRTLIAKGMVFIKEAFPELAKEAGYKSPQECGACKEATNADRKVYESLTPGKFDHLIKKPITGMPQVGQFTPEEYQPILGDIPLELWELAGFPNNLYLTAEGRKTILEDVQRARKAKADWLALPLERKVGLE